MDKQYVQVHLLRVLPHLDIPYTYYIPGELRGRVVPGDLVVVPFGRGNRRQIALAVAVEEQSELPDSSVKPVESVLSQLLRLSPELLELCAFMREHTFCTVGDAVRAILPTGAAGKVEERYFAAEKTPEMQEIFLPEDPVWEVYAKIKAKRNGVSDAQLRRELLFSPAERRTLTQMLQHGLAEKRTVISDTDGGQQFCFVQLAIPAQEATELAQGSVPLRKKYALQTRSDAYARILTALSDGEEHAALTLLQQTGGSTANLQLLEKKGIVRLEKRRQDRNPYEWSAAQPAPGAQAALSEAQQQAFDELARLADMPDAQAALLYGVTGSGKTNVIKALIDRVIAAGRQAILLLPEIALTPQTVRIFCASFGARVAVLHSALRDSELVDAWRRIREGQIDLVIGTRSAIFAPLTRLGLVVLDEEQEHTYKSDQNPKFHARDIARFRCAKNNALMVLASATPSLESFYKAQNGKYHLIRLTERYGSAVLPTVEMADLRQEQNMGQQEHIGSALRAALAQRLERGEQSILFVNRRGYHNYVSCMSCGEAVMCPHCSVSLTLHRTRAQREIPGAGVLLCHYCGYRMPIPEKCPACGGTHLKYFGFGTQRTEDELAKLFPTARVLRMDADTTQGRQAHEQIIRAFKNHEADILLGTQMVTKGHDFPDVTLVGVLNADSMLYQDDYRASEKTFSLLTQVAGRAGRADKPGMALIQTYNPEHATLQLAARQDYDAFYSGAIGVRRALVFPPFCDIAQLTFVSAEEQEVTRVAQAAKMRLEQACAPQGEFSDVALYLFGPFEAGIYRVSEKYRQRLVIKCKANKRTRELLRTVLWECSHDVGERVSVGIDINPTSLS